MTEPRLPFRIAFAAAIVLAVLGLSVYAYRDEIDAWALADWRALRNIQHTTQSCLLSPGQVAHITVSLLPDGQLVGDCRAYQGRTR